MTRIAYVNGRYAPHHEAAVHIEDRGYQFADGVYEVIAVRRDRLVDENGHLDRLNHSLSELRIGWPLSRRALKFILREVIRRNRLNGDGMVYLQVTRGVAPRSHAFPDHHESALVVTARRLRFLQGDGVDVITIPDIRWKRCDIKSISLLPNVLGKQQAKDSEAFEAWMVDSGGQVTEGTLSNAWIVTERGKLITRDVSRAILNGITRQAVLRLATRAEIAFSERPFTVNEAKAAREAFITGTTVLVTPVVRIDGEPVGNGRTGKFTAQLLAFYARHMDNQGKET
jgi:D-alanine transaminase